MQRKIIVGLILFAVLVIFIMALVVESTSGNTSESTSDNTSEDRTQTVDHNGSVETALSVAHLDSAHDVILTTHKVWLNNSEYRTINHYDTVPALDSLTTDAENKDGDTKSVRLKRDYQIFITLK